MELKIKRVYEKPDKEDGIRILVDRLWPRGLTKEKASIDLWLKDIAPSTELRKWFGHDPEKWKEFKEKYIKEISAPEETRLLQNISHNAKHATVTLVYGARDTEHSNVKVLEELLTKMAT